MKRIYYAKKIKKDYQRNNLQNPFFRSRQQGSSRRWLKWLILSIIILLIFLLWLFFSSPWWQIRNIRVEGLTRISNSEIEEFIWKQAENHRMLLFRESNLLLFNREEASQKIIDQYNFANLEIRKKMFHTLEIAINERPYAFIFQQGSDFFYASSDGYIINESQVFEEDRAKYLILENKNERNFINDNGQINIKDDYLSFILSLYDHLITFSDLPLEKFIIDQEFNTIKVDLRDGPVVYFNTKGEIESQVNRLVLVKREKIKDNFNKINYIDLRYGDRVFIN